MTIHPLSKEERILRMMKRVLTDVAKDTHAAAGMKHSLSDNTIQGIRECLALITAREAELAREAGRENRERPHFVDEPRTTTVVSLASLKRKKKPSESEPGSDASN